MSEWTRKILRRVFPVVMETYEVAQPWTIYSYFVPDWVARVTGRAYIRAECAICGVTETITMRMPRWGPVLDHGPHPKRVDFLVRHGHPLQATAPETWVQPLRNPAAHTDTLAIITDAANPRLEVEVTPTPVEQEDG